MSDDDVTKRLDELSAAHDALSKFVSAHILAATRKDVSLLQPTLDQLEFEAKVAKARDQSQTAEIILKWADWLTLSVTRTGK